MEGVGAGRLEGTGGGLGAGLEGEEVAVVGPCGEERYREDKFGISFGLVRRSLEEMSSHL